MRNSTQTVTRAQDQTSDPDGVGLPGAEGDAGSGEAVYPAETLLLARSAQNALFMLLRRDVLLPLTLAVTVLPTQAAVETVLTHTTHKVKPAADEQAVPSLPWLHVHLITVYIVNTIQEKGGK